MIEATPSIRQLQFNIEDYNDEIKDIYTLIHLNLSTIKLEHDTFFKNQKRSTLTSSINLLNSIKKINQQCSNIRLNLLITQQISYEELSLRKQRLYQYEQKIQEQRRLISDKQQNYQTLISIKKKRSPQMSHQQFEKLKTDIKYRQNSKFFDELSSKFQQLKTLNQFAKKQNQNLKKQKMQIDKHRFFIKNKIEQLEKKLRKFQVYQKFLKLKKFQTIPILNIQYKSIKSYDNHYNQMRKQSLNSSKSTIYKSIFQQQQENSRLLKKLNDEIQMTQYLQLQNKNLIKKYEGKQQSSQIKIQNEYENKKQKYIFVKKIDIAEVMSV